MNESNTCPSNQMQARSIKDKLNCSNVLTLRASHPTQDEGIKYLSRDQILLWQSNAGQYQTNNQRQVELFTYGGINPMQVEMII
jgi:hypothetical protein